MNINLNTETVRLKVNKIFIRILSLLILISLAGYPVSLGQAGARTLAANQDPFDSSASIFGAEMLRINTNYGLTQMSQAGAYWVRRNGLLWSDVQPNNKNEWNWEALASLDQELANASNTGMQTILVVRGTPGWAQKVDGKPCGPVKESELDAFGDFMNALVQRYKNSVRYWELWNEPDIDPGLVSSDSISGCWGDETKDYYGGEYYAEMLKRVYPRIKQANPQAQVLVGGLQMDCDSLRVCPDQKAAKFLEGILLSDGGSSFDGISFHAFDYYWGNLGYYGDGNWLSNWNITGPVSSAKAQFIQDLLNNYSVSGKYLINTESALICDSGCDANFETTKAYYVAQSYATAIALNLRANVWYAALSGWRNADLLMYDLTPLPAYDAFRFARTQLGQALFVRKVTEYPGVVGYDFRRSNHRVWLLWSLDGANHQVDLPSKPEAIYHVNGTPITTSKQLQVTLEPKYIEWEIAHVVHAPLIFNRYRPLINGNFELGATAQGNPYGWTVTSIGSPALPFSLVNTHPTYPIYDGDVPLGQHSALLGFANYECNGLPFNSSASIDQTFTVPTVPDGVSLKLKFKYIIYTQDYSYSDPNDKEYDRFEVYLNNDLVFLDGNREFNKLACDLWRRIPTNSGWAEGSVDLINPTDYRGKTITISFQNWSRHDYWYNTFTYLDDVRLETGQ